MADDTPLLDVLRNHLDLKGSRYGCGLEQCGSCMVLIDGEAGLLLRPRDRLRRRPCDHHDRRPRHAGQPHPLQRAFLEEQAGQCGYCLSGIIISAKALLDRNPARPARTSSRRWTSISAAAARIPGIIAAVQKAARMGAPA